MKLADAKVGDVLADKDGALWLKGEHRARCIYDPDDKRDGDCNSFGADAIVVEQAEHFGPFTRLVPEKETP